MALLLLSYGIGIHMLAMTMCQNTRSHSLPMAKDKELHIVSDQLVQRIDRFEDSIEIKLSQLRIEISQQFEEKLSQQEARISELETKTHLLETKIQQLEDITSDSIRELGVQLESYIATINSEEPVGFTALIIDGRYISPEERFIYDTDIIYQGSHYDYENGEFTCPVDGVYLFYMQFKGEIQHNGHVYIVQENTSGEYIVATASVKSGDSDSTTAFAIINCGTGGSVYVRNGDEELNLSSDHQTNTFSGFLLKRTYNNK